MVRPTYWVSSLILSCLLIGASHSCLAQQQTQSEKGKPEVQEPATKQGELAIDQIKKTVVFFHTRYLENGQVKSGSGTGFFVIAVDSRMKDRGVVWLVTNKHMLHPPDRPYFDKVTVRFNTKNATPTGERFAEQDLQVMDPAGNFYWLTDPDDETVDLALLYVSPDVEQLEAKWIPVELILTKKLFDEKRVNENDDVLFAGLFSAYPGSKRNFPIVRHGKLALVTDERIPTDPRDPNYTVELVLAEITSFGGNSGSPVFLRVGGMREGAGGQVLGGYEYYLLGVMKGYVAEGAEITLDVTATARGVVSQNSGIAAVVPGEKILRILNTARAKAITDRVVAGYLGDQGQAADAERLYKQSLAALEATMGRDHPDVADTLAAYAALLRRTGRGAEAKQAEDRVKLIREKANQSRPTP